MNNINPLYSISVTGNQFNSRMKIENPFERLLYRQHSNNSAEFIRKVIRVYATKRMLECKHLPMGIKID